MQRIQLGAPYEEFIKKVIATGYYSTATEVIRDALRYKMGQMEQNRIDHIRSLVAEGQASKDRGDVIEYSEDYLDDLMERARKSLTEDKSIPDHIRP